MRVVEVTLPIPVIPCPDHPAAEIMRVAEPFGPWQSMCSKCFNIMSLPDGAILTVKHTARARS